MDFVVTADHIVKTKEYENRDNYLYLAWELKIKQAVEHEDDVDTNWNRRA